MPSSDQGPVEAMEVFKIQKTPLFMVNKTQTSRENLIRSQSDSMKSEQDNRLSDVEISTL